MNRRAFLGLTSALALIPLVASAGTDTLEFRKDGDVQKRLDAGETVFVDFYTTWCSTCKSQSRTIDGLRAANPDYNAKITFVAVDWDEFSGSGLAARYKIPRRSTLLMLKGNKELGRVVAGTAKSDIMALLNTGL